MLQNQGAPPARHEIVPLSVVRGTMTTKAAAAGLIEVTGTGQWTRADADEHFAALAGVLRRAREKAGTVRVLVDLRTAGAQPAATTERIAHWTGLLYREGDRVAILVASSLLKSQMRRITTRATRELFISEDAARLWLMV